MKKRIVMFLAATRLPRVATKCLKNDLLAGPRQVK